MPIEKSLQRSRPFHADAPACHARSTTADELNQAAIAPYQEVRRDSKLRDRRVVRVFTRIEAVGEQGNDAVASEFAGRQRNAVDDDQADRASGGARIAIG